MLSDDALRYYVIYSIQRVFEFLAIFILLIAVILLLTRACIKPSALTSKADKVVRNDCLLTLLVMSSLTFTISQHVGDLLDTGALQVSYVTLNSSAA